MTYNKILYESINGIKWANWVEIGDIEIWWNRNYVEFW